MVRLTDRPDMTLDVYRGRKTTQQNQQWLEVKVTIEGHEFQLLILCPPHRTHVSIMLAQGWLVGCFGLNGPLRQYFSLYRAVSQREGERREKW